jgi:hypothetical protein
MTIRYPAVSVGCCFYRRSGNYQRVVGSLEDIAEAYSGPVEVFIYFSGATEDEMRATVDRLHFTKRNLFIFECGPNRVDEPKYRLPLRSTSDFIFTTDDDCLFAPDTLTSAMDTYHNVGSVFGCTLSPVGWFGTDLQGAQLQMPIEGRFTLKSGEWRQVDYLGSCGCLYRREILSVDDLAFERWPEHLRYASDLWLSYLLAERYKTPAFVTRLEKEDLPECGYSLWEQHNRDCFGALVAELVTAGWEPAVRPEPRRSTNDMARDTRCL